MEILTLIPARAGSKGLPGKNIKELNGKPLIAYTIEAALSSKYLKKENILCSTDSEKIANVAKKYGAKVPFLRPAKYATDKATSISVAIHALNWMKKYQGKNYDYLLLLQPTSPLRKEKHIDEVIELMKNKRKDSIISITEPDIMPYNMKKIDGNGELVDFIEENNYKRRQDMPEIYGVNGAIYLTRTDIILNKKNFYGEHCVGYLMDKKHSIDVDELFDIKLANFLILENNNLL